MQDGNVRWECATCGTEQSEKISVTTVYTLDNGKGRYVKSPCKKCGMMHYIDFLNFEMEPNKIPLYDAIIASDDLFKEIGKCCF